MIDRRDFKPRFSVCSLAWLALLLGTSCGPAESGPTPQDEETRREMQTLSAELVQELDGFGQRAEQAFANDEAMSRALASYWGRPSEDLDDPFGTFPALSVGVVQMNQSRVAARFASLLAAATNLDRVDAYNSLRPAATRMIVTRIFGDMLALMGRYRHAHEDDP